METIKLSGQTRNSSINWWILFMAGVFLLTSGIWYLISPLQTYFLITIVFCSIFFSSLKSTSNLSIIHQKNQINSWEWNLVLGVLISLYGILLLVNSELSIKILPIFIGLIAIFKSAIALFWGINLKSYISHNRFSLITVGFIALIFVFLLLWNPAFVEFSMIIWASLGCLLLGGASIWMAFKFKTVIQKIMA